MLKYTHSFVEILNGSAKWNEDDFKFNVNLKI